MDENRILEQQTDQIINNLVDQPEELPQQQQEVIEPKRNDSAERNFKALREARERAERERDDALRQLQQFQQKQQEPVEEEDIALGNDDLAEGKHLKKVTSKIKRLEEQLKSYQQQSQQSSLELQLKSQFPDFEKVVSKDNVDRLIEEHPDIGAALRSSNDVYSKSASAYKLIKQFGIYTENSYTEEKEKAQRNATKPRPLASVSPQQGESPMSRANAFANGLTDDVKKALLKEMSDSMKKY